MHAAYNAFKGIPESVLQKLVAYKSGDTPEGRFGVTGATMCANIENLLRVFVPDITDEQVAQTMALKILPKNMQLTT